jgi:hypothetical protein
MISRNNEMLLKKLVIISQRNLKSKALSTTRNAQNKTSALNSRVADLGRSISNNK